MHKLILFALCLSLAGIFILSACTSSSVETQVAEGAVPSLTSEKSSTPSPSVKKASSTPTLKPTKNTPTQTKTQLATITSTAETTQTIDQVAQQLDLLLKNLESDLDNTEIISEIEIP